MERGKVVHVSLQQSAEVTEQEHADKVHEVDEQESENRNQLQTQRAFLRYGEHDDRPQNQQNGREITQGSQSHKNA